MSFFQSSLGIDLRKDGVVLSLLRKSLNQVLITASRSFTFAEEKGKEEREAEIISTIQGFFGSQHFSKENVIVALPREKALVKLVEIPSAAKENLRTVLEYELGKYIPFAPEEVFFDFQVLEERDGVLRILLVVMRKEEVNEYLELFNRMGIRPVAIEIPSTAAANLFYYDQAQAGQGPFALIDIEKDFFEFHFYEMGRLKEDLLGSFSSEDEKARELTEAYRVASLKGLGPKEGKQNFFAYGSEASEILVEKLRLGLSPQMALAQSFRRVQMANGLQKIPESYASIGLALRVLSKTRWNINLLPFPLRKKVSRFGIYLATVLSIIALVLAGTWMIHPLLQEKNELGRISGEVKDKKPKVDAIEAIQKEKALLEKEVREFEALGAEEISKLEILKELSEILPPTVWVWNVKLRSKDIEINGFANSASDLIAILDKSSLLEKVEFSSPVTKERRLFGEQAEKERFRISAKLERMR